MFILHWTSSAAIWLWSSAVADVSISLAAAYSLKSRIVGFNRETDSLLRTLIFIVLRTAAYTAILSVVGAVIESVYKDDQLQSFVGDARVFSLTGSAGVSETDTCVEQAMVAARGAVRHCIVHLFRLEPATYRFATRRC